MVGGRASPHRLISRYKALTSLSAMTSLLSLSVIFLGSLSWDRPFSLLHFLEEDILSGLKHSAVLLEVHSL